MKVLVTGATGFIGRNVIEQLVSQNRWTVVAIARSATSDLPGGVEFETVDLLSAASAADMMARIRPTHWIHLAWNATPGQFWTARSNFDWTASSLVMLNSFLSHGGRRAVLAGSCAEYDWQTQSVLSERSAVRPATLYGVCKDHLRRSVDLANTHLDASLAWGRIFWLYGPGEPAGRLVSGVCAALANEKPIDVGNGSETRDYLHVSDVAAALVAALDTDFRGTFNIGSGQARSVRDILDILADVSGRRELLRIGARPPPANLPPSLVADNEILTNTIGWSRKVSLEDGLKSTYEWWLGQRATL